MSKERKLCERIYNSSFKDFIDLRECHTMLRVSSKAAAELIKTLLDQKIIIRCNRCKTKVPDRLNLTYIREDGERVGLCQDCCLKRFIQSL